MTSAQGESDSRARSGGRDKLDPVASPARFGALRPMTRRELLPHLSAAGRVLAEHARHWAADIHAMRVELSTTLRDVTIDDREMRAAARLQGAANEVATVIDAGVAPDLFHRPQSPLDVARQMLFSSPERRAGAASALAGSAETEALTSAEARQFQNVRGSVNRLRRVMAETADRWSDRSDLVAKVRRRMFPNDLEWPNRNAQRALENLLESIPTMDERDVPLEFVNAHLGAAREFHRHVVRGGGTAEEALAREARHLVAAHDEAQTHLGRRLAGKVDQKVRAALLEAAGSPDPRAARDAQFHLAKHYAAVGRFTLATRALERWEAAGGGSVHHLSPRVVDTARQTIRQGAVDRRAASAYRAVEAEATRRFVTNRSKRMGARLAAEVFGSFAIQLRTDGVTTRFEQVAYQRQGTFLHQAASAELQRNRPEALRLADQAARVLTKAALSQDPQIVNAANYRATLLHLDAVSWEPDRAVAHLREAGRLASRLHPVQASAGMTTVSVREREISAVLGRLDGMREGLRVAEVAPVQRQLSIAQQTKFDAVVAAFIGRQASRKPAIGAALAGRVRSSPLLTGGPQARRRAGMVV